MPRKSWKPQERETARLLGGKRQPNQGVRAEDIAHPLLYLESKQRAAVPEWWTKALSALSACPEDKIPALVFVLARGRGFPTRRWLILPLEDPRVQEIFHAGQSATT